MAKMLTLGEAGSINGDKVLLIAAAHSVPVKRFLKTLAKERLLNLCFGYPQRSVVIFENGLVVLSHQEVSDLSRAIRLGLEIQQNETVPF